MWTLKIIAKPKLKLEKQYNCQIKNNGKVSEEANQNVFNKYNLNALEKKMLGPHFEIGVHGSEREKIFCCAFGRNHNKV